MDMTAVVHSQFADVEPSFGRPDPIRAFGCGGCNGEAFGLDFSMAFQPIVDTSGGRVFAYEALIRGPNGEGAASILSQVNDRTRYAFDQKCRVKAIELAAALGIADRGASVSINFLPNAIYRPEVCIATTLKTAKRVGFPLKNIIFEFTEGEQAQDPAHITSIIHSYRAMGFRSAIDDFGAGYAGLSLLASFQPDIVKIDMLLVRGIDSDPVRRTIVSNLVRLCAELGITVLAEGIETEGEAVTLNELGVELLQGYWFAKPAFECLPEVATLG